MTEQKKRSIMGGSAGSNKMDEKGGSHKSLRMFEDGVRTIIPKLKDTFQGRILPAFDWTMSEADDAFMSGFSPYRDLESGMTDKLTDTPAYTGWFSMVERQNFVGKESVDYISPKTLKKLAGVTGIDAADPIEECFWHIYDLVKSGDKTLEPLIRPKGGYKEYKMFRSASTAGLINVYACDPYDQEWKVMVQLCSQAYMNALKEKLAFPTPRSVSIRDENFPDYLFGDITDPATGLKFITCQVEDNGKQINSLRFSKNAKDHDLSGVEILPVDESVLAQRHKLTGENHCMIFPTYQEIIDFMTADGGFDMEIVKEVCGDKANIGASTRLGATQVDATPDERDEEYNEDIPMGDEDLTEGAPTPEQEDDVRLFWVEQDGDTVEMSEKALQEAVDAGFEGDVVLQGEEDWQTPADYGITKTVKAPPPKKGPPAKKAPPKKDGPPPRKQAEKQELPDIPETEGPEKGDQANTGDEALTAKESKELKELQGRLEGGSVEMEDMKRIATLLQKKNGK